MAEFRSVFEVSMRKKWLMNLAVMVSGLVPWTSDAQMTSAAQKSANATSLYLQLKEPTASDRAARQILIAAKKDSAVRDYITERLPEIIESPSASRVWANAVELAGQLKAASTVSSLIKVLPQSPFGSTVITGFADAYSLYSDPVGRALCGIGDPAVAELSHLLENGEALTRQRAARILWNIDSAASRHVLQSDLEHERDPAIKIFSKPKSEQP
jgi:HEAT repeat protein